MFSLEVFHDRAAARQYPTRAAVFEPQRLRTILTMLGIIIGVAAVLTMVGLGGGARAAVQTNVKSAGTNLVFVKAGNYTRGGESVGMATGLGGATTLAPADCASRARQRLGILNLSPEVNTRTFVAAGEAREFTMVHGVDVTYADMYAWDIKPGRMFTEQEVKGVANVVVIGQGLATSLFPGVTPPWAASSPCAARTYQPWLE